MQVSHVEDMDLDAGFALKGIRVLPRQGIVIRDGERLKLEPKVMAILVELARNPGAVVKRGDFAASVWRGRVVSDEVLSRNVSILRSALGDDAREPQFIQTIPSVGYRLIAEVELLDNGRGIRPGWPVAGIAVLIGVVISAWLFIATRESSELPPTTIAVLPFENLSDARGTEYFSDGLTDEVVGALAQSEALFVVARTSSFVFRDRNEDVRTIGQTLGAGSILEGSVRRSGDLLRVSARLVNANDGLQMWSESFDVKLEDVFVVQDEISRAIVERLVGTLVPESRLSVKDTNNLEAYQLFLRANHQIHRRGAHAVARGVELYEQAIVLDPYFARAYVGLARAYTLVPSYRNELEKPYLEKASAVLDRAEALGAMSARLLGTRAYIHFRDWRWLEAHRYFDRALDKAPNDSDIQQQYSQFLGSVGYLREALVQAQNGVHSDPLSGVAHQRLAVLYLWLDELEKAREQFQIADEMGMGELATPEAYIALLARAQRFDEVSDRLRSLQRQRGLPQDWIDPVMVAVRQEGGVDAALRALNAAYADRAIDSRLFLGALYFIGDETGYFDGLNVLIDEHAVIDTNEILFAPMAEKLRRSPRFHEAMRRMGIADYWAERGRPDW